MPKRTKKQGGGAAKKAKKDYGTISAGAMAAIMKRNPGYVRTGGYYGRFSGPGAELKFFDTALSFNVDATGEVPATGQLVLIPQGVTESTRVGRKCVLKSIQMRILANYQPAAAAVATTNAWIYLVLDKQCNGAAAAVTDVFASATLSTAMHNLSNSQRFVILKKIKMTFNPPAGATTAYNNIAKQVEMFKKCNIPLEFSSTTGAITEIRSNNIFLLAGSDTLSDDTVVVAGNARVRYSDGS